MADCRITKASGEFYPYAECAWSGVEHAAVLLPGACLLRLEPFQALVHAPGLPHTNKHRPGSERGQTTNTETVACHKLSWPAKQPSQPSDPSQAGKVGGVGSTPIVQRRLSRPPERITPADSVHSWRRSACGRAVASVYRRKQRVFRKGVGDGRTSKAPRTRPHWLSAQRPGSALSGTRTSQQGW